MSSTKAGKKNDRPKKKKEPLERIHLDDSDEEWEKQQARMSTPRSFRRETMAETLRSEDNREDAKRAAKEADKESKF